MPNYAPRSHVFVDESKSNEYYIAASAVASNDVNETRKSVRGLMLPGQKRLHFKDEKDSRRKQLLKSFSDLGVEVSIYVAGGLKDKEARPLCLSALAKDLARCEVDRLYLEQDASTLVVDKKVLRNTFAEYSHSPSYVFPRASEEPLLWIADAVAWCYQRRGPWIQRVAPLVDGRVRKIG
ncbi:hypothetical protein [Curtobacterium sp. S6]|uniref:hypothetical protein n=1 Tax=Curtobacterium sp. S6 TaxID=1479623 RepID=UPI00128FBCB5|nr:hypothetical protein [Curtobacterium sp. S6]